MASTDRWPPPNFSRCRVLVTKAPGLLSTSLTTSVEKFLSYLFLGIFLLLFTDLTPFEFPLSVHGEGVGRRGLLLKRFQSRVFFYAVPVRFPPDVFQRDKSAETLFSFGFLGNLNKARGNVLIDDFGDRWPVVFFSAGGAKLLAVPAPFAPFPTDRTVGGHIDTGGGGVIDAERTPGIQAFLSIEFYLKAAQSGLLQQPCCGG